VAGEVDDRWWRRPWAIATGALVLLLVLVGALSSGGRTPAQGPGQAAQSPPTAETSEPVAAAAATGALHTLAVDPVAVAVALAAPVTVDGPLMLGSGAAGADGAV
jgi:hypothetical protein